MAIKAFDTYIWTFVNTFKILLLPFNRQWIFMNYSCMIVIKQIYNDIIELHYSQFRLARRKRYHMIAHVKKDWKCCPLWSVYLNIRLFETQFEIVQPKPTRFLGSTRFWAYFLGSPGLGGPSGSKNVSNRVGLTSKRVQPYYVLYKPD